MIVHAHLERMRDEVLQEAVVLEGLVPHGVEALADVRGRVHVALAQVQLGVRVGGADLAAPGLQVRRRLHRDPQHAEVVGRSRRCSPHHLEGITWCTA